MKSADEIAKKYGGTTATSSSGPASSDADEVARRFGGTDVSSVPPPPTAPISKMEEKSTFGYPIWDETVNQVSKVFSSLPGLATNVFNFFRTDPLATVQGKNVEAAKNLAGGLIDPAKRYLLDDPDAGIFERLLNTGMAYMGADIDAARRYGNPQKYGNPSDSPDDARMMTSLLAVPVGTFGMGALLKAVPGLKDVRVPTTMTRREVESLGSLIARGVREGEPQAVAQAVQPLYKQAAHELGIDPATAFPTRETAPKTDITGNLRRGADNAIRIANHAVDISERPLNAALEVYGDIHTPEIQRQISKNLEEMAKAYDNKDAALASSLRGVARDVEAKGGTVKGLNELKSHANKEMDRLFGASTGKQIAASAQASYAYRLLGDEIRAQLYPYISDTLGGPNLSEYGAREAAAIQARDGLYGTYYGEVAPGQANRLAQTYLEYVTNGSLYHHHLQAKMMGLYKTPIGRFNQIFSRGLGPLGQGLIPEQVQTMMSKYGLGSTPNLLPPPPGSTPGFSFRIQGAPEVVQQLSKMEVTPAQSHPLPMTPTGLDYGAGRGSDMMQNWQYTGETESGPLRQPHGGGTLLTNNPKVVENTIRSIQEQLKKGPPPLLKRQLQAIQTDLINQLMDWHGNQKPVGVTVTPGTVDVTPMMPGTVKKGTAVGRYGSTAVGATEVGSERRREGK